MSYFKKTFKKEIIPRLKKQLNIKNELALPKLEKVVLNSGIGNLKDNKEDMKQSIEGMSLITGQKPIVTKAKKAISAFKIREGMPVGIKVTLRDQKMYDFIERLIKISLPRWREFEGINPKSIDEQGNLTIGLKDVSIFPELSQNKKVEYKFGLEITIVVNAKNREEALELYKQLGFIIKK
jgi:large subunit ribosomal protein L5